MNKTQLVDGIAEKTGLSKVDAKKALEAFIETVSDALKHEERVTLVGFGSFAVTERGARMGRNPKTGQALEIPAKKSIKFKATLDLV